MQTLSLELKNQLNMAREGGAKFQTNYMHLKCINFAKNSLKLFLSENDEKDFFKDSAIKFPAYEPSKDISDI